MKAVKYFKLNRQMCKTFSSSSFCSQSLISKDNIVKSPLPSFPIPNKTVGEFLIDKLDRWADKTAVVCADTGRSFTFVQYHKMSERVAQALCAKLGFKKGDFIAILLPNVPEYLTIAMAGLKAGITLTTINPAYTEDEIANHMRNCSAKAIVTLVEVHKVAQNALKKLQTNTHIPIITVKHRQDESTPEGAINFQELCDYNGPTVRFQPILPEDLAVMLSSSGTTGLPKGVMLTHRNLVSNLMQTQQDLIKYTADTTKDHQDNIPVLTPLYHCYGLITVTFNMYSQGCKSIFLPKYKPNLYLDMLERYPPHLIYLVPPIVLMLINNENAKSHHMKTLRNMISGAAPLADTDIQRFKEKFGHHFKLLQCYGLTETGPLTHAHCLDRELVPGSVGWNVSMLESKVVSIEDETKNLGPNQTGHLHLRGPQIMLGYHNNPKATAESIDRDGWFKTGDVAHYNEDGAFFITDRIKELIKVKGLQVAPAELEALIRGHPDVEDVAVSSVPHELNGEAPKAFVVPRSGSNLQPEIVERYVQERAAKFKHLTGGVTFVEDIPKNPSGKILRRLLKNM